MEIIINIPDTDVSEKIIRTANWEDGSLFDMALRGAIQNATILPKKHGRLIDADALIKCTKWFDDEVEVRKATTIIEATKESELDADSN